MTKTGSNSSKMEQIYHEILYDEEILRAYKEIEKFENENKGWAYHNFEHVKNVTKLVESLLKDLGFDQDFIYKAKIACLLHDIGVTSGKDEHEFRSFEYAIHYFKDKNIYFDGIDGVLEAIKNHREGFETDNLITLVLILADKLDIKSSRISEEGKLIEGNRQYSHIKDILISIHNHLLEIKFITDGELNFKEFNDYYFTKKVKKAIVSFSNKMNLNYIITIDNKEWI